MDRAEAYAEGVEGDDLDGWYRRQNGLAATYDAVKLSGTALALGGEPVAGALVVGGGVLADIGAAGYRQAAQPDATYDEGWLSRMGTGTYHVGLERVWEYARESVRDR